MSSHFEYSSSEWSGPAARRYFRFSLWRIFRALIVPPKGQRILPTVAGYSLILIAIGLGMAAYNASSNILFIALSLLLASLVTSGILSWINFHGTCWRILADPPFRAGEECHIRIEVRNTKKRIPTYALTFLVEAQPSRIKAYLKLGKRLDPQETIQLDYLFTPRTRGEERVAIVGVTSQFPFGFLRKTLGGRCSQKFLIWPQRIPYRLQHSAAALANLNGRALNKPGHGSEFINLRAYRHGDSYRQVHWKASARLRSLVVQQYAAENQPGFILALQTERKRWAEVEQFEKFCSFVSSLAEDLYQADQFHGVQINGEPLLRIVRRSDFELFQDRLATLKRISEDLRDVTLVDRNVVTFEPGQMGGIHAYIGGQKAATA